MPYERERETDLTALYNIRPEFGIIGQVTALVTSILRRSNFVGLSSKQVFRALVLASFLLPVTGEAVSAVNRRRSWTQTYDPHYVCR